MRKRGSRWDRESGRFGGLEAAGASEGEGQKGREERWESGMRSYRK